MKLKLKYLFIALIAVNFVTIVAMLIFQQNFDQQLSSINKQPQPQNFQNKSSPANTTRDPDSKITPVNNKTVDLPPVKTNKTTPGPIEQKNQTTGQTNQTIANVSTMVVSPDYEAVLKRTKKLQELFEQNNIFRSLHLYQSPSPHHFNDMPDGIPLYNQENMGLINDPNYCDLVDTYNLNNPENVLTAKNILTDYNINGLARQVFKKIGNDVLPDEVNKDMPTQEFKSRTFAIPFNTTMIFTKKVKFNYYHEFGKNLFCLSQMYNHIPGHGSLTRKDLNVEIVRNYEQRMANKPECYKAGSFFPTSYRLDNKMECQQFFEILNAKNFSKVRAEEGVSYILKVSYGSHRANGLELLDEFHERRIRRKYENGQLCGKIQDNLMAQKYISNPDLIEGHKYDFRIYILIASTDPLIVYYHDGFLRVSIPIYDKDSKDRNTHFANTNLAKQYFEHPELYPNITKMNETELRNFQMRTMEQYEQYQISQNKVKEGYLNDVLRPQFKRAFIHAAVMSHSSFFKDARVFEMFGMDFVMDDKLNLWFIECNASPVLQGTSEEKQKFQETMVKDMMEIQYAYLRSRWKRITNFSHNITEQRMSGDFDPAQAAKQFRQINKNYLEEEYQISQSNSFTKILDMNQQGAEAEKNIFDKTCNLFK